MSIPLSEVSEVYVSKFNIVGTGFLAFGGAALVAVVLGGAHEGSGHSEDDNLRQLIEFRVY